MFDVDPGSGKVPPDVALERKPFFSVGAHGQGEVVEGRSIIPSESQGGGGLKTVDDAFSGDGVLFGAVKGGQVGHGVVPATLVRLICHFIIEDSS